MSIRQSSSSAFMLTKATVDNVVLVTKDCPSTISSEFYSRIEKQLIKTTASLAELPSNLDMIALSASDPDKFANLQTKKAFLAAMLKSQTDLKRYCDMPFGYGSYSKMVLLSPYVTAINYCRFDRRETTKEDVDRWNSFYFAAL